MERLVEQLHRDRADRHPAGGVGRRTSRRRMARALRRQRCSRRAIRTATRSPNTRSGTPARGGGHFVLNGVAQGTNQEIDVTAAQLSQLSYQSGSGADTLWVRANDGTQWGNWSSSFTVTAPIDTGPGDDANECQHQVLRQSNLRRVFAVQLQRPVRQPRHAI